MRRIILALLLFATFAASAQTTAKELSWYKMLVGKIDKYPIVMHLHKMGTSFSGSYYYQSQQHPLIFSGQDSGYKKGIKLFAYGKNGSDDGEWFQVQINAGQAIGSWKKEGGKSLVFTAKEIKVDSVVPFDYVFTKGRTRLAPKSNNSPEATFEASAVWPKGNTSKERFLKKVILEAFGEKETEGEIGGMLLKQKRSFLNEYLNEYKGIAATEWSEFPSSYNMDESTNLSILYQSSKIIVLSKFVYSYGGGAHGNYSTSYVVVDLEKQKIISLEEVLTKSGIDRIKKLLPQYFRKQFGLKETDPLTEGGLFEDKLEPNDNFYVTGKGIAFSYQPYEVGPYAMGEIELFIPFTELKGKLHSSFEQLIQ